jgi:hypothetical protein
LHPGDVTPPETKAARKETYRPLPGAVGGKTGTVRFLLRGGCGFCKTLPESAELSCLSWVESTPGGQLIIRRSLVRVQPPPPIKTADSPRGSGTIGRRAPPNQMSKSGWITDAKICASQAAVPMVIHFLFVSLTYAGLTCYLLHAGRPGVFHTGLSCYSWGSDFCLYGTVAQYYLADPGASGHLDLAARVSPRDTFQRLQPPSFFSAVDLRSHVAFPGNLSHG